MTMKKNLNKNFIRNFSSILLFGLFCFTLFVPAVFANSWIWQLKDENGIKYIQISQDIGQGPRTIGELRYSIQLEGITLAFAGIPGVSSVSNFGSQMTSLNPGYMSLRLASQEVPGGAPLEVVIMNVVTFEGLANLLSAIMQHYTFSIVTDESNLDSTLARHQAYRTVFLDFYRSVIIRALSFYISQQPGYIAPQLQLPSLPQLQAALPRQAGSTNITMEDATSDSAEMDQLIMNFADTTIYPNGKQH
jgi:hypothetical protein